MGRYPLLLLAENSPSKSEVVTHCKCLEPQELRVVVSGVLGVQGRIRPLGRMLYKRRPVSESCTEQHIRVREQTLLQRYHDKLRPFKPRAEQLADMLGVRKIQCSVELVEDVHWCGFELQ